MKPITIKLTKKQILQLAPFQDAVMEEYNMAKKKIRGDTRLAILGQPGNGCETVTFHLLTHEAAQSIAGIIFYFANIKKE
jgi:hypothetical protein